MSFTKQSTGTKWDINENLKLPLNKEIIVIMTEIKWKMNFIVNFEDWWGLWLNMTAHRRWKFVRLWAFSYLEDLCLVLNKFLEIWKLRSVKLLIEYWMSLHSLVFDRSRNESMNNNILKTVQWQGWKTYVQVCKLQSLFQLNTQCEWVTSYSKTLRVMKIK